jgi:putative ABC transport system permease protein
LVSTCGGSSSLSPSRSSRACSFSLAPALAISTQRLVEGLKEGGWGGVSAHGRARVRNALVVGQFALTLVLANAAALVVTSWVRLRATELGFTPDEVMVAAITLRGPAYADLSVVRDYYDDVIERVEALPGVQAAGAVSKLPMYGGTNTEVTIAGREDETGRGMGPLVEVSVATPGYFRALGIRLLAGRDLEPRDSSPADPSVVINRTFAERIWPGESAVGKRFAVQQMNWKTVVGVVDDVRQWGLERPAIPEAYVPYMQVPPSGMHSFDHVRYLIVRAEVDPTSLASLVRREAVAAAPTDPPVVETYGMSELVEGQFRGRRFSMVLLGLFAAMALVLVAAGIYGVMSYFVAQRRQEVGVRVALGASRDQVLRLVMVQGMKLAAVGVVFGLAGALASSKAIAGMLYGVNPIHLPTLTAGALFMVGVGFVGSMVPALRAA